MMNPDCRIWRLSWHGAGRSRPRIASTREKQGSEDVRKEFESELAKKVSGKKSHSKAWTMIALCAAVIAVGAFAVNAVVAGNAYKTGDLDGTPDQDRLQDGTGDNCDCDCDGDGVCDYDSDGDGICDYKEDGTCPDCLCDG